MALDPSSVMKLTSYGRESSETAADVPIRTMTLVYRIQFHVKPQALQLLVMERP